MSQPVDAINNRHVWIFREARTGGTVCSAAIARYLGMHHVFIENINESYPYTWGINTTHQFDLLPEVISRFDPIMIRISRKDKVEQFLSKFAMMYYTSKIPDTKFISYQADTNSSEVYSFIALVEQDTVDVEESNVIHFANECLENDRLWNKHSPSTVNQTIYYEDLSGLIDLPVLGLNQVSLFTNNPVEVKKLPEYKKQLFSNYDQVSKWMNEYYYEHCT